MRFDCTTGQEPIYQVAVHRWNGDDFYYFHYLKCAKNLFTRLKDSEKDEGTSISITNIKNGSRKAYVEL